MSQIDYSCDYPGIVQTDETCFRFTDKSIQASERLLYSNWWREQINQFGVKVNYYVNTYNTLSADNFYGEQPTQTFADPRKITLAVTLNENAINLSKFGFESDDEVTAYIHISSFYDEFVTLSADFAPIDNFENEKMLQNGKIPQGIYDRYFSMNPIIEPKAGDVFELTEYGDDRPNSRQAKFFEITEKLDQDISQINNLQGHYVFLLKAKRLDYSFEPNINFNDLKVEEKLADLSTMTNRLSDIATEDLFTIQAVITAAGGEFTNDQVYEDAFAGRLPGGINPESRPKREDYELYSADDMSKKDVFDMSDNDTDVYGDYY
tara:strand:- start:216 stop:1178 length:963 start_codon:yes stop_codon:yes gene_type:complete